MSEQIYKLQEKNLVLQDELSKTRRLLKTSSRLNSQKQKILDNFLKIKAPSRLTKSKSSVSSKDFFTPIIMWSDWHVEGVVEKSNTHGLNEFNPKIAKNRIQDLVKQCVQYIKNFKHKHTEVVLWLGGDFIEGWIHEELAQTNAMSPIEATQYAIDLLHESILELYKNIPKSKKLTILCNYGNHSRITQKMQHGNQEKTNYEHLIYSQLQKLHPKCNFVFSNEIGYYTFKKGGTVRFCHGHQIRSIAPASVERWKSQVNKYLNADLTIFGHFHTMSTPAKDVVINGSVKGFDEYAYGLGLSFDEPRQGIITFDNGLKKIKAIEQIVMK